MLSIANQSLATPTTVTQHNRFDIHIQYPMLILHDGSNRLPAQLDIVGMNLIGGLKNINSG
jgi:hypothetical protein